MGYRQLTQDERYVMARLLRQGYSYRAIALALDRSVSTISRERSRNATRHDGNYRAEKAHQYALARRRRTRKGSQFSEQEWAEVARLLERKWSPGQIVGRRQMLRQPSMSKESIYRYVRRHRREGGQLWRELRILSKFGRKRRGSPATRGRLVGKLTLPLDPVSHSWTTRWLAGVGWRARLLRTASGWCRPASSAVGFGCTRATRPQLRPWPGVCS